MLYITMPFNTHAKKQYHVLFYFIFIFLFNNNSNNIVFVRNHASIQKKWKFNSKHIPPNDRNKFSFSSSKKNNKPPETSIIKVISIVVSLVITAVISIVGLLSFL